MMDVDEIYPEDMDWHATAEELQREVTRLEGELGAANEMGPRIMGILTEIRDLLGITDETGWATLVPAEVRRLRAMRARAQHLAEHHPDPAAAGAALRILGRGTERRRVDPAGCGCTDCITGYSVPADVVGEDL